jgi:hypothetical protein
MTVRLPLKRPQFVASATVSFKTNLSKHFYATYSASMLRRNVNDQRLRRNGIGVGRHGMLARSIR